MTKRILFVCLGNICRSPAAEGVFRALCSEVACDSAGTASWHSGKPPYEPMQEAAHRRNVDLSALRARQFAASDFDDFDLIIAMDDSNLEDIEALRPKGHKTPVKLFTDYAPQSGMDHVPDPYYTRDFESCLDLIEEAAQGLKMTL